MSEIQADCVGIIWIVYKSETDTGQLIHVLGAGSVWIQNIAVRCGLVPDGEMKHTLQGGPVQFIAHYKLKYFQVMIRFR